MSDPLETTALRLALARPVQHLRFPLALLLALLLEVSLLGLVSVHMARLDGGGAISAHAAPPLLHLRLQALPRPAAPDARPPAVPRAARRPVRRPAHPQTPLLSRPLATGTMHPPALSRPTVVAAASPPTAAPSSAAPSSAAPSPPAGDMPRQQFVAQLNAAIQAALVYPSGARALNQQGQARVGFVLRDGALEQLAIVLSSGKPGLDRAALQAVLRAHLPAVPEALRGQSLPCQISVSFSLQSRP